MVPPGVGGTWRWDTVFSSDRPLTPLSGTITFPFHLLRRLRVPFHWALSFRLTLSKLCLNGASEALNSWPLCQSGTKAELPDILGAWNPQQSTQAAGGQSSATWNSGTLWQLDKYFESSRHVNPGHMAVWNCPSFPLLPQNPWFSSLLRFLLLFGRDLENKWACV